MHIWVAAKKNRQVTGRFFCGETVFGFFLAPWKQIAFELRHRTHFAHQKDKTGSLAYFFGETAFGFSVAPSEGKANLDCYPVVISPRKKPPGTWVFFFGGESASWFFCAPWRKIKFEFRPGTRFATKDNDGVPGFLLRRNRLFFLIVLGG